MCRQFAKLGFEVFILCADVCLHPRFQSLISKKEKSSFFAENHLGTMKVDLGTSSGIISGTIRDYLRTVDGL